MAGYRLYEVHINQSINSGNGFAGVWISQHHSIVDTDIEGGEFICAVSVFFFILYIININQSINLSIKQIFLCSFFRLAGIEVEILNKN